MGLIKKIFSCILEHIKIRGNFWSIDMANFFSKPKPPPPPDTSGIEALERRQAEREKSAQRSLKARQRATAKGGPLMTSMQNFQQPTQQLASTLGPRQRPT